MALTSRQRRKAKARRPLTEAEHKKALDRLVTGQAGARTVATNGGPRHEPAILGYLSPGGAFTIGTSATSYSDAEASSVAPRDPRCAWPSEARR